MIGTGHSKQRAVSPDPFGSDLNTLLYQLGIEVPMVEFRFSLPKRRP
jgi:hypothetical protein